METSLTRRKDSIQRSIVTISTRFELTPEQAWKQGTNVRESFKHEAKMTHIALVSLLKDAVEYLDFNKSFRHEGDYIEAVTYLIEEFPVMKLEEWKLICIRLKAGRYGKMYERLKLPELVEIFQQFEGERAEMMERERQIEKADFNKVELTTITKEQKELWRKFVENLNLPEKDTDERGRWKCIEYPNTPIDDRKKQNKEETGQDIL